jgi:hypothetical protein
VSEEWDEDEEYCMEEDCSEEMWDFVLEESEDGEDLDEVGA